MEITLKDHLDAWDVHKHIYVEVNDRSRFKANVSVLSDKRIKISQIRLKESKPYCGSHPFVCDVAGGRKARYLEGADWVEFNDLINDVLDKLNAVAYVRTAVCIIRKGAARRLQYGGHWIQWTTNERGGVIKVQSMNPVGLNPHPEWNRDEPNDEAWGDWRLKVAPNSWYPLGTPGKYERQAYVVIPSERGWKREDASTNR